MWFGYYPEIIFCHFFCNLNLVIFKCTIMAGDINSLNLLVSSETTRPIELKFHMKTPYDRLAKIYTSCTGHMTKMATTPIYGKNS